MALNLTQSDIAERIGVGQAQVCRVEHGYGSLATVAAYLRAVGRRLTSARAKDSNDGR